MSLEDVVVSNPHLAAAIRAIEEADQWKREANRQKERYRQARRELDAAKQTIRLTREAKEKWKQRCLDHEWALGIRRGRRAA